jgi:phosphoribosyl-AMP cyclohydrolase
MSELFAPRRSVEQVEEGTELAPRFDEHGLIPVVTTDHTSGELLMHGFMNAEALRATIRDEPLLSTRPLLSVSPLTPIGAF